MAEMMVGREVNFKVEKEVSVPQEPVLQVRDLSVFNAKVGKYDIENVSFDVRKGEILCIAGIEGNGQTQLVEAITGLTHVTDGQVLLNEMDITRDSIRTRNLKGVSHIPEDRHKHGLVLEYSLEENLILQTYFTDKFQNKGFLDFDAVRENAHILIDQFDIRSGKGPTTDARSMSGGNQQKAIVAREIDRDTDLLIAVQPTRGLDVGAIEYIHKQLVKQRDEGKAVLLISLELDEVMNVSDRIIVMYEGETVGEFDPDVVTENELGLYMAGSKRSDQ
jgi:simple sugar transport system ATP-binding protein